MSFNVKKSSPGNLVHMNDPKRHLSLGLTGVPVPKPLVALPTHCRFFSFVLAQPTLCTGTALLRSTASQIIFFSVPRRRIGRLPFPRFPTLRRPRFPVCGFFAVRSGMSPWAPKKINPKNTPKNVCASFPLGWHRPAGDEVPDSRPRAGRAARYGSVHACGLWVAWQSSGTRTCPACGLR